MHTIEPDWLSAGDTASRLGVSIKTLRRWDAQGKLRAERTAGGHRRYRREAVETYWQSQNNTDNISVTALSNDDVGIAHRLLRQWVSSTTTVDADASKLPTDNRWWPLATVVPVTIVIMMVWHTIAPTTTNEVSLVEYWSNWQADVADKVLGGIGLSQSHTPNEHMSADVLGSESERLNAGVIVIEPGETEVFVADGAVSAETEVDLAAVGRSLPVRIGAIDPGVGFWVVLEATAPEPLAVEWRVN
jgi:excisionase family DNA binding protein